MSRRRRAQRKPDDDPPRSGPTPPSSSVRPPRFVHYLLLTLAFWGFLALQAVVLMRSLGSSQTVILFSVILGAGFLVACVFDYVWLRSRR